MHVYIYQGSKYVWNIVVFMASVINVYHVDASTHLLIYCSKLTMFVFVFLAGVAAITMIMIVFIHLCIYQYCVIPNYGLGSF